MGMKELLLQIAEQEVGYIEKESNKDLDISLGNPGDNNFTKFGDWYNLNGYAWCAMFVSWCADQAGIPTTIIPKHASCSVGVAWWKNQGRWHTRFGYTPTPGDIIYFSWDEGATGADHVGIVVAVEDDRVYTIEGNTSAGTTLVPNGGCVAKKNYSLSYACIYGYGNPNYPVEVEDLTEDEFKDMMIHYFLNLSIQEPEDWSLDARTWAEQNSLILGNERRDKQYRLFTTREQMVVFIHRLYQFMGGK